MLASFSQHKLGASSPSITLWQKSIVPEWMNQHCDYKSSSRCANASVTHPKITNSPYLDLGLSLWASASDSARIGDSRPSVLQRNQRLSIWNRFPSERSMLTCDVTMRCARKNTNKRRLNREQLEHKHCSCEAGKKQRKANPEQVEFVFFFSFFFLSRFVAPSRSLALHLFCFFSHASLEKGLSALWPVMLPVCSSLCFAIPARKQFRTKLVLLLATNTHGATTSGTKCGERRRKGTKKPNENFFQWSCTVIALNR